MTCIYCKLFISSSCFPAVLKSCCNDELIKIVLRNVLILIIVDCGAVLVVFMYSDRIENCGTTFSCDFCPDH